MLRPIAVVMVLCFATVTAQAALLGRAALTPGGTDYQAYYDDVLDITWLADANLAASNSFGVEVTGSNGRMTWYAAQEWISAMNTSVYLGLENWRLPVAGPIDEVSLNFSYSTNGSTDWSYNISAPGSAHPGATMNEMAHLFFNTLGNPGYYVPNCGGGEPYCHQLSTVCQNDISCLINTGPFSNLRANEPSSSGNPGPSGTEYWSGTDGTGTSNAAFFYFREGYQDAQGKMNLYRAWAVHDGDLLVATVPVPSAVWLFGSALGVMGVMRRKAALVS